MEKVIKKFRCVPFICTYNTDNFKIYAVEADDKEGLNLKKNKYGNYTIMGDFHELALEIPYHVKAEEQKSKNGYGYQYKVMYIRRDRPTNEHTTRMFLSEFITPEQVNAIMEHYPDIVDRVIQNRLDDIDLNKLYNIKEYRFNVIKRKIEENFVFAELIEMFQGLIDIGTIRKLYERYPSSKKIKQVIQENPYHCFCSLARVGFKKADSIILELDKESKKLKSEGENPVVYFNFDVRKSLQRTTSAIEYLLEQNENDGHTRLSIVDLKKLLDNLVPECSYRLVEAIKDSDSFYIDKDSKTISFKETYETELYIAKRLVDGLKQENKWDEIDINEFKYVGEDELTDEQFNAVKMFYKNNISILNGGGGVGKSFTTEAIISLIKRLGKSFYLLCPTGRFCPFIQ